MVSTMEALINAIQEKIPIIDHHAHNLLMPSKYSARPFLALTSEASGSALKHVPSTLAHMRAVKQLADVLHCEPNWEKINVQIEAKRKEPEIWAQKCFRGIELALIDDGLDQDNVHPFKWHNRLTRSPCKRIVRIERVAEEILARCYEDHIKSFESKDDASALAADVEGQFIIAIKRGMLNPDIAGFKSVICYRTGLAITEISGLDFYAALGSIIKLPAPVERFQRLQHDCLNPYFVHLTARVIEQSTSKKPFQFHTGLGDNDINLSLSSPAYLQGFIRTYPSVPIVLLHASYPFTREAAYLASTYENVFMDIGEVFPMLSQEGQENVIRESLELCPSEKLLWSTDGHSFPETFLLAVIQVKDALQKVLCDYVRTDTLTIEQAIQIVSDIFFNTSNKLYELELELKPLSSINLSPSRIQSIRKNSWDSNIDLLMRFLDQNPSVKFFRLQWLDFTSQLRLRILPIKQLLRMNDECKFLGIAKVVLGLLQQDEIVPGFSPTGEYKLYPDFGSLRLGARTGYATVQCQFREPDDGEVATCPRTFLRRMVRRAQDLGIEILVGFEIEVVFMKWITVDEEIRYINPMSQGHSWSASRPLHDDNLMCIVEAILENLEDSSIIVQQFHAESAPGQFEFILSPMAPLAAVDTLLSAREIICETAAKHSLRATLVPKPYAHTAGTGSHIHISLKPSDLHEMFYSGVLKHMQAITAFTYSKATSFDRVMASCWAGGNFVSWGMQNRETPLRQIDGSHFEIRCVDGFANMYLALGAILGAGLQGVLDSEPLVVQCCLADPAKLSKQERRKLGITQELPTSIEAALDHLRKDSELREILGKTMVDTYLTVKKAECSMLEKMDPGRRRNWLIERY